MSGRAASLAMLEPGLIRCGPELLRIGVRTLVMGILNLTPDSFSGDGLAGGTEHAARRGEAMVAAGADVLDLGGESTRPGSETVPARTELGRVLPSVERLAAGLAVPISIDTRKAGVARAALAAGATLVNDVSGLDFDPELAGVAADAGAALIVGHWRRPREDDPEDMVAWVAQGLEESVARARAAGIPRTQLIVDPGLGFAKPPSVTFELLRRLPELRATVGLPVLIGASRKSSIGRVLELPVEERLEGSVAAAALAVAGGADMVRVHDVPESVRAIRVADAIVRGWAEPPPSWTPVYLGLGANLGDRSANLARAILELAGSWGVRTVRRSGLYETTPVGVTDQPPFLNAVLEAETTLDPAALLALLKRVEGRLGREPGRRWGPRPIDLDVLLYGTAHVDTTELTIPHASLWERAFALAPLVELQPDLPGPDGRSVAMLAADLSNAQGVRALGW